MFLIEREVGFSIKCQPCLAKRVMLNFERSRNPKPPSSFDRHKESEEQQCRPFLFAFFCHQYLTIIDSNSLHKVLGNRKHTSNTRGLIEGQINKNFLPSHRKKSSILPFDLLHHFFFQVIESPSVILTNH